jgi:3-methyladenine DNA glycosylase AlkD
MAGISEVEGEARSLHGQIMGRADPQHRESTGAVVRTELVVHGVRVPHLREIAREWQRDHKQIDHGKLVALVELLWNGQSLEERILATLLLERYKHLIPDLTMAHFDRWRRGLDNWALTDGLGWVLALWVLGDTDAGLAYLGVLVADEDVWSRRLALVATVRMNRESADPGILDHTLGLVDRVKEEHHPMVTKAVSWVLRELTRRHRDRTIAYLEENREVPAAHLVREVDNKLRTGLKSGKGARS